MMTSAKKHLIYSQFFIVVIKSWSLALNLESLPSLGIGDDFYVSDIVVHFNKAFLAIPRTICNNNVTHPTLVEVPWRELNVIIKSRFNKYIDGQVWANCHDLQNAISLAKEGAKSKLWVLDQGNEFCPPKLVAYSLLHNSFLTDEVIELEVPQSDPRALVVEEGNKLGNHRAFIASGGENKLLVCYLSYLSCREIKLLEANNKPIYAEFLSISKIDATMYLTGHTSMDMYSLKLDDIPEEEGIMRNESSFRVPVKFLGEKLGPSSALETDSKGGLFYYLTRDYAVVRWITDEPLQAENHEVLLQSFAAMPYVSRIFADPQGGIMALVNPFSPKICSRDVIEEGSEERQLERVVQIVKYNWLLDKFL